ncbi:MAG: DUF2203 domain-containing protein [Cyanobacteria bacterium J06639_18]
MNLPDRPSQQSEEENLLEIFEGLIFEAEQTLQVLKDRYGKILAERQRQIELAQRLDKLNKQNKKQTFQKNSKQELKLDLEQVKAQLETLEDNLGLFSRSYLALFGGIIIFSKSGLQDAFWQVIRFAGLGVIIGWLLKSFAG